MRNMVFRIELDPEAVTDAEEIRDWIAELSPDRAARWFEGLLKAIETLKTFPRRCPRAPERESYGGEVRQFLYGKRPSVYRVLFRIQGDEVRVVAVLHGARGTPSP